MIEIKVWQNFLISKNFEVGNADGIWGAKTEAATKKFQSINNLTPDGIIGHRTLDAAKAEGLSVPKVTSFNPSGQLNAVCDISHHNENINFTEAKSNGLKAVFHKATQSGHDESPYHDKMFKSRRIEAENAGLLWGAYHFGTGGSGIDQANLFLDYSEPDNDSLLVLDFERCTTVGETDMSLQEAIDFVNQIKLKTGKYPGIYGGSLLKEMVKINADPVLSQCWLWVAQYGPTPHLPNGWSDYAFWQYTDGNVGPSVEPVIGIGYCDREFFNGSEAELLSFWEKNRV